MKTKKFYVILFLSITITFMFFALWLISNRGMTREYNKYFGWRLLYPFEEEVEEKIAEEISEPEKKSQILAKFSFFKSKINQFTEEGIPYRYNFIEAARRYEDLIHWNMTPLLEYNPVEKQDNGYLLGFTGSVDVSDKVKSTVEFAKFCSEKEIKFLYVAAPSKTCIYEDKSISGILDFSNHNADRFLRGLEEKHINYYDLRKILHDEGMNHHEAFFKTDHHWKPETGLWAAKHILEFLRDNYGWDVKPEILNPENFEKVIYPEWFLGSQGKKLTLARSKPDDISLFYPKYKTSLNFTVPSLEMNKTGSFDIIYFMKEIEHKDYYNLSPYYTYSGGDFPIIKFTNMLETNNKHILVIKDSFAKAFTPFLALGINRVDEIDLRYFNGSLRSYIKSEDFDAIIILYGIVDIADFRFKPHQELYDFR
ncbi:MAG: hypothetical protein IJU48_06600 [Synergistaceae bacterium]|nr:hypothetical protein [Synergistaceae bacterium]